MLIAHHSYTELWLIYKWGGVGIENNILFFFPFFYFVTGLNIVAQAS